MTRTLRAGLVALVTVLAAPVCVAADKTVLSFSTQIAKIPCGPDRDDVLSLVCELSRYDLPQTADYDATSESARMTSRDGRARWFDERFLVLMETPSATPSTASARADEAARQQAAAQAEADARAAADAASWLQAETSNSIAGFQAYLDVYPEGARASDARSRLAALFALEAQEAERREAEARAEAARRAELARQAEEASRREAQARAEQERLEAEAEAARQRAEQEARERELPALAEVEPEPEPEPIAPPQPAPEPYAPEPTIVNNDVSVSAPNTISQGGSVAIGGPFGETGAGTGGGGATTSIGARPTTTAPAPAPTRPPQSPSLALGGSGVFRGGGTVSVVEQLEVVAAPLYPSDSYLPALGEPPIGLVLLDVGETEKNRALCEGFTRDIRTQAEASTDTPAAELLVTYWMMRLQTPIGECNQMLANYDYGRARAIKAAYTLADVRGPIFLAYEGDGDILFLDLSQASAQSVRSVTSRWASLAVEIDPADLAQATDTQRRGMAASFARMARRIATFVPLNRDRPAAASQFFDPVRGVRRDLNIYQAGVYRIGTTFPLY